MKHRTIQIHVQPLAQFVVLDKNNFQDLPTFNAYKKNKIYQQRNQFISKCLNKIILNDDFVKTEFGKPYLLPHHLQSHPHFSFNHSHSQNYYALATSNSVRNIGVDIEDLDRKVRFEALAKHAFHPNEYQTWESLEFDPIYWFKVWTTKEAVLKASGLGIRMSLNELDTQAHATDHGGICQHPLIGVFAYQNYQLSHSMLAVAWQSEYSCKGFAFPQIEIIQH
ncbi:4'-phosphopantetheinyl transferase family protein [Acinetobacter sp. ANC 3832]|uniref:4'-phosphopantetheinyl transferase family protein n=1 Tax=Acinetobacter sp. ANC 3832 TaxID=1977874 RepID=UPI000A330ABF|nr:4'-phosphopantetheinyl transferase superfamily protein [Acinetobacter sp. ANC 3832]OTG96191.1 ACP synthase [Acinetobacter sp. ANC 3832]